MLLGTVERRGAVGWDAIWVNKMMLWRRLASASPNGYNRLGDLYTVVETESGRKLDSMARLDAYG